MTKMMTTINPVSSTCKGVCTTLYDDVCRGCGRTAEEVALWSTMTEQEQAAVMRRILESKENG